MGYKLKQRLQNPFALMAQGFLLGLVLFWTTLPGESSAHDHGHAIATESAVSAGNG